ncbi:hypothetical protein ACHAXA_005427 [Cyclostephanos tholiformis]|uniref:Uncharacterized protein n=1 Tax=Cyclostephanos tholiformis TaxID=382380 RepID=A0ABD3RNS8_9STRA
MGWHMLDDPFPCNPSLGTSVGGDDDDGVVDDVDLLPIGEYVPPPRPPPTSSPTPRSQHPSSVSGIVWYDSNGDGRINTDHGG